MAVAAAVTQYRDEHIAAFEQNYSILRATCVTHAQIKGNSAVFLVSGSGGATAVTRGQNGLIPYGQTTNTQSTCTLLEKHAPFEMTGFNIFASQGDQRRIMQMGSVAVLNRDIDQTIIDELDTSTLTTGTSVIAGTGLNGGTITTTGSISANYQAGTLATIGNGLSLGSGTLVSLPSYAGTLTAAGTAQAGALRENENNKTPANSCRLNSRNKASPQYMPVKVWSRA